jgi:hypothetical protein
MRTVILVSVICWGTAVTSAQADGCSAPDACRKFLELNPASSIAHYTIGEGLLSEKNYQSAALEFLAALKGDLEPKWTVVWSHIQLGKIFDITHQRDRAVREYRLAQQSGDNMRGALDQAAKYLETQYSQD